VTVERRLATLLLVLGLIAVPAAALRAFCVGNSCAAEEERIEPVPFCSLERSVRDLVSAGFYEGRSPDVLGVTGDETVTSHAARSLGVPWPSTERPDTVVPVVLLGPAFTGGALPDDLRLNQIAPTLEPLLGFERPFPEVRSGRAIPGAVRPGATTPLTVIVVWRGVGMPEIEDAIEPVRLLDHLTAGLAQPGSIPLDPAAVATTIGTGGLPSEHGITGAVLGTEDGPARAFSTRAPGTVIATLGDDLDEVTGGEALVGMVAADRTDRGLIGWNWYGNEDDDTVVVDRRDPVGQVERLLGEGWGRGNAPDLLGVTLVGEVEAMDAATSRIVDVVQARVPEAAIVVTATGSLAAVDAIDDRELAERVERTLRTSDPVIAGSAAGGFFVDDEAAAAQGITSQQVADAMAVQVAGDPSSPLFDDTFPSFTVRFGRYC
jgi:hypothetical protein